MCGQIIFFFAIFTAGAALLAVGDMTSAAWCTTFIYLVSFAFFAIGSLSQKEYIIWSLAGFVLLVPHLFDSLNCGVMINEFVGASVGVWALLKILRLSVVPTETIAPATTTSSPDVVK